MSENGTGPSANIEVGIGADLAFRTIAELEAALNKLGQTRNADPKQILALEAALAKVKGSVKSLEAENKTLEKGFESVSKAAEKASSSAGKVDKTLKTLSYTNTEAGQTLAGASKTLVAQFEVISKAASGTASNVKKAIGALDISPAAGSGLSAYYQSLQNIDVAVAKVTSTYGAMAARREQVIASMTSESAAIGDLRKHYQALEQEGIAASVKGLRDLEASEQVANEKRLAQTSKVIRARQQGEQAYTSWWASELTKRDALEQSTLSGSVKALKDAEQREQTSNSKRLAQTSQLIRARQVAEEGYTSWWVSELDKRARMEASAAVRAAELRSRLQRVNAERLERVLVAPAPGTSALARDYESAGAVRGGGSGLATAEALSSQSVAAQASAKAAAEAASREVVALGEVEKKADQLTKSKTHLAAATKRFSDTSWEAHSAARGLAGSLGMLWATYGSLAPLLAGAALAASFREVISVGKDVSYQLTFVSALGGEAAVSMDKFGAAVKGSMFSLTQAAEGMRAMAQSGLNTTEALSQLPGVLKLATVGEMTVAEAAYAATGVMHAFNLTVEEMGRVGNVFAKAAAVSNTSVKGMMEAMRQASTVSDLYGVSLEETAASLAIMAKRNIEGSAAGTALRNAMNELATPIKASKDAMAAINFEPFDEATKKIKPLPVMLQELQVQLSDLDEKSKLQFLDRMFGERGAKAVNAILSDMKEFNKTLEEMKSASAGIGFVSKVVQELEGTLSGKWKALITEFQTSLATVYNENEDAFKGLVDQLRSLASSEEFINFLRTTTEAFTAISRLALENLDVISKLAAAYGGFKVLSAVSSDLSRTANSFEAAKKATDGADKSIAGYLSSGSRLLGWLGTLSAVLVPIVVVWQDYVNRVSGAEAAQDRFVANSNNIVKALSNEYNRLAESNEQLAIRNQLLREGKNAAEAGAAATAAAEIGKNKAEKGWIDYDLSIARRRAGMGAYANDIASETDRQLFRYLDKKYEGTGRNLASLMSWLEENSRQLSTNIAELEGKPRLIDRETAVQQASISGSKAREQVEAWNTQLDNVLRKRTDLKESDVSQYRINLDYNIEGGEQLAKILEDRKNLAREGGILRSQDLPTTQSAGRGGAGIADKLAKDMTSSARTQSGELLRQMKDASEIQEREYKLAFESRLISEGEYNEKLFELGKQRANQAAEATRMEIDEINRQLSKSGISQVTKQQLSNDKKEAEARLATEQSLAANDIRKLELDRELKKATLINRHTDALVKLNEQQKLNNEAEWDSYNMSLEVDPIKLAGLQAQLSVARQYSDLITSLNRDIAASVGDESLQAKLEQQLAGVVASMEDAKVSASRSAEDITKAQLAPMAGIIRVIKEVKAEAVDLASTFEKGLKGSLDIAAQGFTAFATTGKLSIGGMVNDILAHLSRLAANRAFNFLAELALDFFAGAASSVSSSGAYSLSSGGGGLASMGGGTGLKFNALGNAFSGSGIHAFARGGAFGLGEVLTKPTYFKFASGGQFRSGVAGEAGPEAALPLKRMANGRLGVFAEGQSSASPVVFVNVHNNASGSQAEVQQSRDSGGNLTLDIIVEQIEGKMSQNIARGRSPVSQTMEGLYGLNRARGAVR